jgi:hypothetical protein
MLFKLAKINYLETKKEEEEAKTFSLAKRKSLTTTMS